MHKQGLINPNNILSPDRFRQQRVLVDLERFQCCVPQALIQYLQLGALHQDVVQPTL